MNHLRHLVLVRHGESEPNAVQAAEKAGVEHSASDVVYSRHDSEQRLSATGCLEAAAARTWLAANVPLNTFDAFLVSPFVRAMETAAIAVPTANWLIDQRVVEQDWGVYGATPKAERDELYPATNRMRDLSDFYARYDNGESVYDVTSRCERVLESLERNERERVLIVAHGRLMSAFRCVAERMTPTEWAEMDNDPAQKIRNCTIIEYLLENGGQRYSLSSCLRRITYPAAPAESPFGGEWVKLTGRRSFTAGELAAMVKRFPTLIN